MEECLTFHCTHEQYSKPLKRKLAKELTTRSSVCWRLSTELLQLQLAVREATKEGPQEIESKQMAALTLWKMRSPRLHRRRRVACSSRR